MVLVVQGRYVDEAYAEAEREGYSNRSIEQAVRVCCEYE